MAELEQELAEHIDYELSDFRPGTALPAKTATASEILEKSVAALTEHVGALKELTARLAGPMPNEPVSLKQPAKLSAPTAISEFSRVRHQTERVNEASHVLIQCLKHIQEHL